MAIVNNLLGWAQQGVSSFGYFSNTGLSLSTTGQQSNTIPASGTFLVNGQPTTYTKGFVRVRLYNFAGTSPTATFTVTGTDGTNTATLYTATPVSAVQTATTSRIDVVFDFNVEEAINKITILTTLGGTGPTASMDTECVLFV